MDEKTETKEILKSKKPKKFYFGNALKFIGATLATAVVMCGAFVATNFHTDTHNLPSQEDVTSRMMQIYGDEDKMFVQGGLGDVQRLPCPKKNDFCKVNINFPCSDKQKTILEDVLSEFNDVFEVINDNYKFAINYNPSTKDKLSPYSINVKTSNLSLNEKGLNEHIRLNISKNVEGDENYYSKISIDTSISSNLVELKSVFAHELSHSLGLSDAYLNPDGSQETIMQINNSGSLSKLDVATLDALYRSKDNKYSDEYINDFIANYEKNNPHTVENTIINPMYNKIQSVDINRLKEKLQQKYGSAQTEDFFDLLGNEFNYNHNFNGDACNFGELTPKNFNEKTKLNFLSFSNEIDAYKDDIAFYSFNSLNNIDISQSSIDSKNFSEGRFFTTSSYFTDYFTHVNYNIGDYVLSFRFDKDTYELDDDYVCLYKSTQQSFNQYYASAFEKLDHFEK